MGAKKNGSTAGSQASLNDITSASSADGGLDMVDAPQDIVLTEPERKYLLFVQKGDVASVADTWKVTRKTTGADVNCKDPLGTLFPSPWLLRMRTWIFSNSCWILKVKPKDALLHAIAEEYVEGVEVLLAWEEKNHKKGTPYSWEIMTRRHSHFYQGHHTPHPGCPSQPLRDSQTLTGSRCGCDECLASTDEDSLRHSLSRINAYKALSSPSLIALSSKDPHTQPPLSSLGS
ncbi:hypothetical protein Pcinc_040136 [Petrolisthes cinctipes]|uniref:Transient receptor ion channel domain-containing protein n=1 Tax=Petrolisthes cinctipes TaxID=88211 RepID=A0AAE1BNB5_PETCI|nr:hypothetical protein Pcinc_040136 [Petrolisthes cinctipes]